MNPIGPFSPAWLLEKLGSTLAGVRQLVEADHRPIMANPLRPDSTYHAFILFLAVAPSRSPKPRPSAEFIDYACRLVNEMLPDEFPEQPDYAGPEMVRYSKDGTTPGPTHMINIYPSGLVALQWILAVPPDSTELPLAEILRIVRRMQAAALLGTFWNLHRPRRGEPRRRLDWHIGVNGWAYPQDGGTGVYWTGVIAAGRSPTRRATNPRPHSPANGFSASRLRSLSPHVSIDALVAPALEELLSYGGYTDSKEIKECVADVLTSLGEAARL